MAVALGQPRRHFRTTDSTNDRARELAVSGAPSGTVVTADEQTAGRGRRGRAWTAPRGKALLCSAILRELARQHALLPLAVPLAVCEAVESLAPVRCGVKWPNDVWIEDRKVAGALIEARPPDWAVIGVGINLSIEQEEFPPGLRWPAGSVGHGVSVDAALHKLMASLGAWVDAEPEAVLSEFAARDVLRGHRVEWEGAGSRAASGLGVAEGVDEVGNLVVVDDDGERHSLGAGEVQLAVRRSERGGDPSAG